MSRTTRVRGRLALSLVAALCALVIGCVEATPGPTATSQPTAATSLPGAHAPIEIAAHADATIPSVTRDELATTLMRAAVCWYDDPALAATCAPAGAANIDAIEAMGVSGEMRLAAPLIDMLWLDVGWERPVRAALSALTGERLDDDAGWYEWSARRETPLPPGYVTWKGRLLALLDARFATLLTDSTTFTVRPDQLVWAGVGIADLPPLDDPPLVHSLEQRYLDGSDEVYGLVQGGLARAYPLRVLRWHVVLRDEIDGTPIIVVACELCGGAAAFDPRIDGVEHRFVDAGLVYDSRRLLVDDESGSLWDAFTGRAVAGPMAAAGAALQRRPLVTATWEGWASMHPNTSVLSLETGHLRDYSSAAIVTHRRFPIGERRDGSLAPEARVIGVALNGAARAYRIDAVAAAGIVRDVVGGAAITLISAGPGRAVRIYATGPLTVSALHLDGEPPALTGDDGAAGTRWIVQEHALTSILDGRDYRAVPWLLGFWRTWQATHPETTIWDDALDTGAATATPG